MPDDDHADAVLRCCFYDRLTSVTLINERDLDGLAGGLLAGTGELGVGEPTEVAGAVGLVGGVLVALVVADERENLRDGEDGERQAGAE